MKIDSATWPGWAAQWLMPPAHKADFCCITKLTRMTGSNSQWWWHSLSLDHYFPGKENRRKAFAVVFFKVSQHLSYHTCWPPWETFLKVSTHSSHSQGSQPTFIPCSQVKENMLQENFYISYKNSVPAKPVSKSHQKFCNFTLNNNFSIAILENRDSKKNLMSYYLVMTWFNIFEEITTCQMNQIQWLYSFYCTNSCLIHLTCLQDHPIFQMLSHDSPNSAVTNNPPIVSNFLINRIQNLSFDVMPTTSRYWGHFHETN